MESGVHLVVKDPAAAGHCEHFATCLFHRGRNREQFAIKVDNLNRETTDATLGVAPTSKCFGGVEHFKRCAWCAFVSVVVGSTELDGVAAILSVSNCGDTCVCCWTTRARHCSEHRTSRRIGRDGSVGTCWCICRGRSGGCRCRCWRGVVGSSIRAADSCECDQGERCECTTKVQWPKIRRICHVIPLRHRHPHDPTSFMTLATLTQSRKRKNLKQEHENRRVDKYRAVEAC